MRVLNGKLLAGERFDQLEAIRRSIPRPESRSTASGPEMLRGTADHRRGAAGLPCLRGRYGAGRASSPALTCASSLKAGDIDRHAVRPAGALDTLLLASLAHPHESSHGLGRRGSSGQDGRRHTALGDARTGRIFLHLILLLRQRRIATLGQAREGIAKSHYAGLRY